MSPRRWLIVAALPLLATHPQPDWSGELRADLRAEAWFDEGRTRGFLRVGGYTSKVYRAWKVDVADLDSDGTSEIVLGVWSSQRRHAEPDPHRSIWVLRWDEQQSRLVDAWRGSALARPLRDFAIENNGLVAFERVGARCFRTEYRWTGFGFEGAHRSAHTCEDP